MANIKSQIKRNKQNEKAHQRNKATKSSLRTSVRKFREAADGGNLEEAGTALRAACRQLDKAASKGVIHKTRPRIASRRSPGSMPSSSRPSFSRPSSRGWLQQA